MWQCGQFSFDERLPIVIGILNCTPDSFSDGGLYCDKEAALAHARALVEEGASIIDIGGESTRPGATPVDPHIEQERIIDIVRTLADEGICVSVDTRNADTAYAAIKAGASIINDVSGFTSDDMAKVAKESDTGLIVMHMRSNPADMQKHNVYDDVVEDVARWLKDQAKMLVDQGIERERICIDPGPGFAKDASQTQEIVRNFHLFARLGYPLMCAISRKSFLGKVYGIEDPLKRDEVSAHEALQAAELGATIIRTHNVAATTKALKDFRPLVVLGLGSNIALVANEGEEREGKMAQINMALSQICTLPDSQIVDISSYYASEPAYYEDQEEFVNNCILLRTGVAPRELLTYLHAIENSLGRTREIENGPRVIDLDIVDYQSYVIDNELLTLPHKLALEREFVIAPLYELRPNFVFANGVVLSDAKPKVGKVTRI